MDKGTQTHGFKVDIRISVLKLLHASWMTTFFDKIQNETNIILNGWKQSGMTNAVSDEFERNNSFKVWFYFKQL